MSSFVFDKVSKAFNEKDVLSDFSLDIPKGSRVCIMGKSGSGKTTIINILLGNVIPDKGSVQNNAGRISVVFQEDRLCEDFSALRNVRMVCNDSVKATECLVAVGLEGHLNKPVKELSGGMKRRVCIARAISVDFDMLVLDEPFKGLDDGTKSDVLSVVDKSVADKTLVLVSHDAEEAKFFGASVVSI